MRGARAPFDPRSLLCWAPPLLADASLHASAAHPLHVRCLPRTRSVLTCVRTAGVAAALERSRGRPWMWQEGRALATRPGSAQGANSGMAQPNPALLMPHQQGGGNSASWSNGGTSSWPMAGAGSMGAVNVWPAWPSQSGSMSGGEPQPGGELLQQQHQQQQQQQFDMSGMGQQHGGMQHGSGPPHGRRRVPWQHAPWRREQHVQRRRQQRGEPPEQLDGARHPGRQRPPSLALAGHGQLKGHDRGGRAPYCSDVQNHLFQYSGDSVQH